jgi:hypothetical protein
VLSETGKTAEALKAYERVRDIAQQLRDSLAAGWARRTELDEPDFDAVGQRDDFRQLLQEPVAQPKSNAP